MSLVIIISSVALFLSFLFNHRKHDPWQLTNWPVVGMLPGLLCNLSNISKFRMRILEKNGWTFVLKGPWFVNMNLVLTSDPMNVHHILTKNFTNYHKGRRFREVFEVLGDGILAANSDSWKSQRKSVHSFIKNSKVERYLENITQRKVEKGLFSVLDYVWEEGIIVDMEDVFKRFTFDTNCQLILGVDPNCLSVEFPENMYYKAFDEIEEAVFHRAIVPGSWWKLRKWLQIGKEKNLTRGCRIVDKFFYECISLKQEKLRMKTQMEEEEELDLLTAFIVAEEGNKSEKFLRDLAINLLSAGKDTVSSGLTWFFWMLARHPSVENKILQEIKANMETDLDHHRNLLEGRIFFNIKQVNRLVYLHAALCETLRLYPPLPINERTAVEADTLPSGHHINQNAKIFLCLYAMGKMEAIWGKDCLDFKPERWISEKGRIVHVPSYKFTAFIAGPRTCIGRDMGFIVMKMVAASLIWNYEIQVAKHHPVSPSSSIGLYMKHGLKGQVFKRHTMQ